MGNNIVTKDLAIGYPLKKGAVKTVFDHISLELHSGELTSLLGLNGAGKSTLLKTLCGFLPPLAGEILIGGKPLGILSKHELARLIGVVLTEKTSAGGITVYELVSLGRYPYTDFFGQLKPSDHQAIESALDAVGILHKADAYLSQLSDGERQKAFIAKALAQECPIIILDEPTAFLDIKSRIDAMDMLKDITRTQNKAVLLSTHDLDTALRMSDRLWLADTGNGEIVTGTPAELLSSDIFRLLFGEKVAKMLAFST